MNNMSNKEHTLASPITIEGRGIHTGKAATITLSPAPENHGVVFQRTDLAEQPTIKACLENVSNTDLSVTIEKNGASVQTVEHLLSALMGNGVDNVLVEINAPEVPILDGSAKGFTDKIQEVGITEQTATRRVIKLHAPIVYEDPESGTKLTASPSNQFSLDVIFSFQNETKGSQYASLTGLDNYNAEIANSRTFCCTGNLETVLDRGLGKGGGLVLKEALNSVLVVLDEPLSPESAQKLTEYFDFPLHDIASNGQGLLHEQSYRHNNELARHKLLDVIGDLALLGAPIQGNIVGVKPSHKANVALAKLIEEQVTGRSAIPSYNPKEFLYDLVKIKSILPHRAPFLLVDAIHYIDHEMIIGSKRITYNEPYFEGHFPENPIMPGVLQIEAAAQVGAILTLSFTENPRKFFPYFTGMDQVRFKKIVHPGSTLVMSNTIMKRRHNFFVILGEGFVENSLVFKGIFKATLVEKDLAK